MLVAGCVAALITMGFHPVGPHGGLPSPQGMAMLAMHDRIVHTLGIVAQPIFFLGAMALTRRLTAGNRVPLAALVVYGFAVVAIMVAAAMSGFVGADILSRMVEGDPKLESRRMMLDYTFRINQAFAAIYTVGACAAIFLWSLEIVRTRRLAAGLGWYGLVLGPVIVLALCSGHLSLDVHGFGLVTLIQSIWFVIAGVLLMRCVDAEDQPPHGAAGGGTPLAQPAA